MRWVIALLGVGLMSSMASAVVINEFWADDAFGDDNEYVELWGQSGESLAGSSLIVVDGDTGGSVTSSNFNSVKLQVDLTANIPASGFYLIGGGPDITPDLAIGVGSLQNGSQTYALVRTADIEYCDDGIKCAGHLDPDELTPGSVAAITAGLIDGLGTLNGGATDHTYFGAPVIGPNGAGYAWDTASRFPNGVDTDSPGDWFPQDNYGPQYEVGSPGSIDTPGAMNLPEPATMVLLGIGGLVLLGRRRLN